MQVALYILLLMLTSTTAGYRRWLAPTNVHKTNRVLLPCPGG